MEAYLFDANACNNNTGLSCEDVVKVSGIFRSSLANPEHAIEEARSFADRLSPTDETLHQFISKIARHSYSSYDNCVEESRSSQFNTRTETNKAQNTHDHFTRPHREQTFEQKNICCHGKLCTHMLDLIILSMAAATNFTATVREKSWNYTDKSLLTESSHDESKKMGNFFRGFSLRIWKRGIKSVGLFSEKTAETVPRDDERANSDDTTIIIDNNNKEAQDKDELREVHSGKQNETIKCTEKGSSPSMERSSPSTVKQVTENTNIDNFCTSTGGTSQTDTCFSINTCLKSDLVDDITGNAEEYSIATVKKLQHEKEIRTLREERNVLRTQAESLIKEKREIKVSLGKVKTEKGKLTREYKQLKAQFDEHERSTRQHTIMLNTRLERLQHAKLAADQGCLKLSLKQERLVVYEQHVTLICQRLMKTVRRELEQTQDLFDIAKAKCSCSTIKPTQWNEDIIDGEGLTMYEAHHRLEKQVLKLIYRYRAVIQLLSTEAKADNSYKDGPKSHFSMIEAGKLDPFSECEHFEPHCAPMAESDSSC